MARTMLESLIYEKSSNAKKTYRRDLDEKYLSKMINFLQKSYYWPMLLQLPFTLEKCCDLSQLWFREFYLEMTMGKRIQVGIISYIVPRVEHFRLS
jgi:cytoplasmic FMR1 interacting protein